MRVLCNTPVGLGLDGRSFGRRVVSSAAVLLCCVFAAVRCQYNSSRQLNAKHTYIYIYMGMADVSITAIRHSTQRSMPIVQFKCGMWFNLLEYRVCDSDARTTQPDNTNDARGYTARLVRASDSEWAASDCKNACARTFIINRSCECRALLQPHVHSPNWLMRVPPPHRRDS